MTIFNFNNCFLIELYRQTKYNTMGWGHKYNYSDIFRIYLTILTVAMPVVTIEHTSVFTPSNCIIP